VKKVLIAFFLFAVSSSAMAVTATLVAHNQRASSGTLSTLIWDGSNATSAGGMAVGAVASTATWDWDYATNTLTGTGLFQTTSHISSNPMGSSVISDRVTDLVIDTDADTTAASTYECREGNFLATVGAHGCGNYGLGDNFTNDSSIAYNVGGVANCVNRTLGGDDASTGDPRGLFTAAAVTGCDAVAGAFDLWTVIQAPDPNTGGTLIIGNSTPISAPGANYMTFQVDPIPLPATAWLIAPAVLAAARFGRRRKAA
jgi:hypothetical protein